MYARKTGSTVRLIRSKTYKYNWKTTLSCLTYPKLKFSYTLERVPASMYMVSGDVVKPNLTKNDYRGVYLSVLFFLKKEIELLRSSLLRGGKTDTRERKCLMTEKRRSRSRYQHPRTSPSTIYSIWCKCKPTAKSTKRRSACCAAAGRNLPTFVWSFRYNLL